MKPVLNAIILVVTAFVIVKITQVGWRFWSKSFRGGKKDTQLTELLERHVYKLAHQIGDRSVFKYGKLEEAAAYITDEFRSYGYNAGFQYYTVLDKISKNIIAVKKGVSSPEEIIIVGAHYDTCYNPGADDNASAVAGLLELAARMADKRCGRTIKFIAFVNEEPPFFKSKYMGSRVYTMEARKRKENIKAALILESIGYYSDKAFSQRYPPFFGFFFPNKGNFISVVGNFSSGRLVKKVVSGFKKQTPFPVESVTTFGFIPGIDFSDNWSFWQEDYPAVMITDTAFYRNPNYHTASDTYETLNYGNMAEVIKGLNAVLMELSN